MVILLFLTPHIFFCWASIPLRKTECTNSASVTVLSLVHVVCFFSFPLFLLLCNDGWKLCWQSDCPDSLDGHLMIRDSSWNETDNSRVGVKYQNNYTNNAAFKARVLLWFYTLLYSAARRAHVWYKTNLSHWEYICSESRNRGEWSCLMGWSF